MFYQNSLVIALSAVLLSGMAAPPPAWAQDVSSENCTFRNDPTTADLLAARTRRGAYERALRVSRALGLAEAGGSQTLPRNNFIDEHIFGRLETEGVAPARLAGDEEFLRRVTLDLTGQTPSPSQIRAFLADGSPEKRSRVIGELLDSEAFVEKWTIWLGDLLQNARFAANRSQQIQGRNAMHEWIRASIAGGKSFRDIAWETVATTGNNYDAAAPGVNFVVRSFAPMGPAQDTYDMMLERTARVFLGLGHYDCLLCHDGRRHLDSVSAWGAYATRAEAQRMAAFFSRTQMTPYRSADQSDPYAGSYTITDRPNGQYNLNVNFGNRPSRILPNGPASYTPVYRDGRAPSGGTWREEFARFMIEDPMFARNFANRLWKAMFNLALAEPVDALDPDRLDPATPPPPGWDFQASHPALLEELTRTVRENDFNLRETLRIIANSTAYQLSSRYEGEWDITKAELFARRIPRRLEGEEVHDAILRATATSVPGGGYVVPGWEDRVPRAMLLPDPLEPRGVGAVNAFLNSFQRGNRDTVQREQSGSILMMLQLMNSPLVNDRVRLAASPFLRSMRDAANPAAVVDEMFLAFLARHPSSQERAIALRSFENATSRAAAVEDLAWALINRVDFLFSY